MHQEFEVSIITVNYNGLNDTCDLLDSITFNDRLEVIVVDNGSKEDEAAIIAARYPQVQAIRSKQNLGFAGGNNLGIKAAQGRYLYFINNDTIFKKFNLQPLIDRLVSDKAIGMVCPKIRFAWGNNPIQYAGFTPLSPITLRNKSIGFGEEDCGQYDTPHPTPYAHGAAMMAKREAIDKVGLMPECYFLYYEELDWSMMFTRAGYEIWYEPACEIFHKESQTTGQSSPLKTYYITRNRFLFAKRNTRFLEMLLTFLYLTFGVATRDMLYYGIKGQRRHVGAIIRGLRHFLLKRFGQYK